jgi:hypothetical protein
VDAHPEFRSQNTDLEEFRHLSLPNAPQFVSTQLKQNLGRVGKHANRCCATSWILDSGFFAIQQS